jgi:hypothetical protein
MPRGAFRGSRVGGEVPNDPPNFIFLQPAVRKIVTMHGANSACFALPRRLLESHGTYPIPSANYPPRTYTHSTVINQPTRPSLYHSTSLMCISTHNHKASISASDQDTNS